MEMFNLTLIVYTSPTSLKMHLLFWNPFQTFCFNGVWPNQRTDMVVLIFSSKCLPGSTLFCHKQPHFNLFSLPLSSCTHGSYTSHNIKSKLHIFQTEEQGLHRRRIVKGTVRSTQFSVHYCLLQCQTKLLLHFIVMLLLHTINQHDILVTD